MVRSELVERLGARNSALSASQVEGVVDAFFDTITERLVAGGRVELRGFGAFSTRARHARQGRNPRSGAPVEIAAKRAVHFRPGKSIALLLTI